MNPENTVCPTCQRPVVLSYLPALDPLARELWTCPHCRAKHPSSKPGTVVIVAKSD